MRTWNYGLVSPGYLSLAYIQFQSSKNGHQRARTRQSGEAEISNGQECWWHLQCHRKPGGKNANRIPNRGLQENLKLAIFLFHDRWRCTFDSKVTWVWEDAVHLLAGQKRFEDDCKDPDMLPKNNSGRDNWSYWRVPEIVSWCHESASCICN